MYNRNIQSLHQAQSIIGELLTLFARYPIPSLRGIPAYQKNILPQVIKKADELRSLFLKIGSSRLQRNLAYEIYDMGEHLSKIVNANNNMQSARDFKIIALCCGVQMIGGSILAFYGMQNYLAGNILTGYIAFPLNTIGAIAGGIAGPLLYRNGHAKGVRAPLELKDALSNYLFSLRKVFITISAKQKTSIGRLYAWCNNLKQYLFGAKEAGSEINQMVIEKILRQLSMIENTLACHVLSESLTLEKNNIVPLQIRQIIELANRLESGSIIGIEVTAACSKLILNTYSSHKLSPFWVRYDNPVRNTLLIYNNEQRIERWKTLPLPLLLSELGLAAPEYCELALNDSRVLDRLSEGNIVKLASLSLKSCEAVKSNEIFLYLSEDSKEKISNAERDLKSNYLFKY